MSHHKLRIINQMVDTLKFHYYPSQNLTSKQMNDYNVFIEDLKDLKAEAMNVKADNNDTRFVNTKIQHHKFNVMARSVKSFSVILQNGDISIAFKSITDKSNNPILKVEFRSEFLTRYGYVHCIEVVNKLISSFLPEFTLKTSEIHLATDIQGYDFTELDKDRMSFRNRGLQDFTEIDNTLFSSGIKKTGFSFGKDAFMLRIYDKTHQINYNKHAGYVKPLRWEMNELYNEDEKVWRLEFQFRREYLKTLVGKDGILDGFENVLNSIPDLWKHATDRFVHYNLSKEQCVDIYLQETQHQGKTIPLTRETIKMRKIRAGISPLWKELSTFNNTQSNFDISKYKEIKKPEVQYVVNSVKSVISCTTKLLGGNWDKNLLTEIILNANEEEIIKKGYSLLDGAKLKAVEHLNQMKSHYHRYGTVVDGFEEYNDNLQENLLNTLKAIDDKGYRDNFFEECVKRGTIVYGNYTTK